ncbi:hypothetical protein ES703_76376 [subsurface metagenome]
MKTKVVALDVYGTILPTEGKSIKRKGLDTLLSRCKYNELILCTCSDGKINDVKHDLMESGVNLEYFDNYFEMPRQSRDFTCEPKDFTPILDYYHKKINLAPHELLIVGEILYLLKN